MNIKLLILLFLFLGLVSSASIAGEEKCSPNAKCRTLADQDHSKGKTSRREIRQDCRDDKRKLCSSLNEGAEGWQDCLKEHVKDLSAACAEHFK